MLQETLQKQIEAVIEKGVCNQQIAGACVGVYQHQQPVVEFAGGYADREVGKPMELNTMFRIFSMTKPVTAVAVMHLWEQGKLDLNDSLWWYFPQFKDTVVETNSGIEPLKRDIKLYDLLNMTSGIPYPDWQNPSQKKMAGFFDEINARLHTSNPVSTMEFCERVGKDIPLMFQPGEQWAYGASADILGGVIEKAADMPFADYLQQTIFDPLQMQDTGFYVPEEKQHRFAQLYTWDTENGGIRVEPDPHLGMNDYLTKPAFSSGGAGLISTLHDYAEFANMLAGRGVHQKSGVRILGEYTHRYLTTPQLTAGQMQTFTWDYLQGYSYGNLMRILQKPEVVHTNAAPGEYGWDGWTGTYLAIDPNSESVLIYMIQNCGAGHSDIIRRLRAMTFGAAR